MDLQESRNKTAAMRAGELKMKREGEYWTDEEREILKIRFLAGISASEIALDLERTESAVYQQAERMQMIVKNTRVSRKSCPDKQDPVCLCSVCTLDRSLCPRCEHYRPLQEVE